MAQSQIKMKKENKKIIILITSIIVGIVLIIFSIYLFTPKPKVNHEYFTLDPVTWIEENTKTENPEDIEINLYRAARGKVVVDVSQEDYYIDGNIESFFFYGSYKGNDFQSTYLNHSFYDLSEGLTFSERDELANNLTIMRITNIITPKDNKINGFILGKEENNIYSFFIFLDEDWKDNLEFTNILWGDNFNDPDTLNVRPFDFSKNEKGIYINEIKDDIDWFKKRPREGGIVVGEINKEILSRLTNYEEVNVTYIMVR